MPSIAESLTAGNSQMQAALDAGIDAISIQQDVVFTQYTKIALAADGYVFWVATSTTLTVTGALHYASDRQQSEDETIAANHVLFSSEQEVTQFNASSPLTMWVGSWPVGDGLTIQVVFGQRGGFFDQAEIWHYSGFAVYPALSAQLVASEADLPTGPIVSNSTPIWLALSAMAPVYPSFLVPDNLVPPYIVAHVEPSGTQALQAFPILVSPTSVVSSSGGSPFYEISSSQLMRDEVDLTLYGFTNQMAIQYLWMLIDASQTQGNFGFANSPAIQDAKRTQVEIAALAQKKMIHISANYDIGTSNAIAYRLILQALLGSIVVPPGAFVVQDAQRIAAFGSVGLTGTAHVFQDAQVVVGSGNG